MDSHLLEKFWVVTTVFNPVRFASRYRLFEAFEARMKAAGVNLLVVEVAFGDREFKVTSANNPNHVQLRTQSEVWLKENALNIGISRLPADWEYVAWIDADVRFLRDDWALETVQQLQHHHVVQLFQSAIDLGPTGEAFQTYRSFAWSYVTGQPYPTPNTHYYPLWHPGFAWGADRAAIDHLGGLIDFAALGAGDHHMALALIGKAKDSLPAAIHPNYAALVEAWQKQAETFVKRDLGYVSGTIVHEWHGKKTDRRYQDRWKILTKNQFDPLLDLKRDWQFLYQLSDLKPQLRDDIRAYFRARNEDSVDLE